MTSARLPLPGLLLAAAAVLNGGGDAPRTPAEELRDTVRELRELRVSRAERQRVRDEAIAAARRSTDRLDAEIGGLDADAEKLDSEIARLEQERDTLRTAQSADAAELATLARALDEAAESAARRVRTGPDFRRDERLARLGAATDAAPRRLAAFADFLEQELRLARSAELLSAPVDLGGGRVKPARLFRVGHLVLGFVTEDEREAGLWNQSDGRFTVAATPELDAAVRRAVAILERQRPPALVALPVAAKRLR